MATDKKPAGKTASAKSSFLDSYFGLTANGTNVPHRSDGGPDHVPDDGLHHLRQSAAFSAKAGMDKGAVFVATCIAAAVCSVVMGLYANYPIALAPGMGLNAFFAFTVVLTYKYTWQQALAAVFLSGVLFFLLSIFRICANTSSTRSRET